MLFNSISFAIFLPVVFFFYWFIAGRNYRFQNWLLLISSYFFYACWDWRFLFLLIFSTALDFFTGLKIHDSRSKLIKQRWLWISVLINLGFLGIFKYYNFFASSFAEAAGLLGLKVSLPVLNIILPVGISFYTFHGLSYVFDLYRSRIVPERDFVDYSLFVSYFPLLVAGPIERATHLLPQVSTSRAFNYSKAVDGLRQILWGLFKKIVIADNCAVFVNQIFENSASTSGSTLALGALLFAFQIYGDFSGYSDIALGVSRLFGIELLRNFAFPYFSRDIPEFWRRWHISLSSWFRDYLYVPLGGSKGNTGIKVRNTFIIFLVSGFWHGANWTFIIWGFLNALYFMPYLLTNRNRKNLDIVAEGRTLPNFRDILRIGLTFSLTTIAWIFFRSESIGQAFFIIRRIFSASLLRIPDLLPIPLFLLIGFFLAVEWLGRESQHALQKLGFGWKRIYRWAFYYMLLVTMFVMSGKEQAFIYFQF